MAPKKSAPSTPSAAAGASSSSSLSAQPGTPSKGQQHPSLSNPKSTKQAAQSLPDIGIDLYNRYIDETPSRVKMVDAFLFFLVVVGAVQFLYCVLVGNYPFNAFLSGFSATVGQFVLTASLRMQTNPANKDEFPGGRSDERAFADFVFGSLILHFFCVNFIN